MIVRRAFSLNEQRVLAMVIRAIIFHPFASCFKVCDHEALQIGERVLSAGEMYML